VNNSYFQFYSNIHFTHLSTTTIKKFFDNFYPNEFTKDVFEQVQKRFSLHVQTRKNYSFSNRYFPRNMQQNNAQYVHQLRSRKLNLMQEIEKEKEHIQKMLEYFHKEYQKELYRYNYHLDQFNKLHPQMRKYQYLYYNSTCVQNGLAYLSHGNYYEAFRSFSSESNRSNPDGLWMTAICYLKELCTSMNLESANRLLDQSLYLSPSAPAYFWKGMLFKMQRKFKESFSCFEVSKEYGFPPAIWEYGICLLEGIGTEMNIEKGQNHLFWTAETGEPIVVHKYIHVLRNHEYGINRHVVLAIYYEKMIQTMSRNEHFY
jgi:tetratricopeptide (TPR) repeat protein